MYVCSLAYYRVGRWIIWIFLFIYSSAKGERNLSSQLQLAPTHTLLAGFLYIRTHEINAINKQGKEAGFCLMVMFFIRMVGS